MTTHTNKTINGSSQKRAASKQEAINAMLALIDDVGPQLEGVFACAGIAHDEAMDAHLRTPDKGMTIMENLTCLRPSELLDPLTAKLYRAHVQEMIERIVQEKTQKEELEAATAAELCCLFGKVGQLQSLPTDDVVAFQKLFAQVFQDAQFSNDGVLQESYPGRADEIVAELRRGYRQPRQRKTRRNN